MKKNDKDFRKNRNTKRSFKRGDKVIAKYQGECENVRFTEYRQR